MRQPDELKSDQLLKWSPGTGVAVWELFCACVRGDLPAVRLLLDADPRLARCSHAYRTPLYFAVRENRQEVVALLLERGADPLSLALNDSLLDICRDRGYAELASFLEAQLAQRQNASRHGEPAAQAIRERDVDKLRRLLAASPELLHTGDWRSNQPIHWAVMTRQLEFIDELLGLGANIEAQRFDGARPIQLIRGDYYFRGWRDVPADWPTTPAQVQAHLRSRGADCDICTASHCGDLERVRELLTADPSLANRTADYTTYYVGSGAPLKNAASGGHIEIVRLLLAHGADPNLREEGVAPQGHALYAAAANRHYETAKLLLEHGAFPNPEVESSADGLSRAISNDDKPMIELLCSYGASRGLHLLAYDGDLRTAAAVLAANPRLADDPEALANAAGEGHESFVRLLLRYQPQLPKKVEFPGWLVGAKTPALNELLFAQGLDPSQPDWLGVTALHQFARTGDVEKARQFLDHGADLAAHDEDICSTPLGWAAKFGQMEMARLLLERGALVNHPDDPPWATPLAWATRRGRTEMTQWLLENGAR